TTLRRSVSGHVNSVRILGTRRNIYLIDESRIRNLLAPGSQRSALFFMETEFDAERRPMSFVFHGGGWGHGVGMCQSGAIGRAHPSAGKSAVLLRARLFLPSGEIRAGSVEINLESDAKKYRFGVAARESNLYFVPPGAYRLAPTRGVFGGAENELTVDFNGHF